MPKSRIVGIIQARMGSTRLPGKSLLDVEGKPLLERILDRLAACRRLDALLVATTTAPEDEPIRRLAARKDAGCHCGSVDDVLDRYRGAAAQAQAGVIVRLTADDPFKDPEIVDASVDRLLAGGGLDYVSNTLEPTFPEGLDVEVFTREALERAWTQARLPSEREHVTPYIWKNPDKFRLDQLRHERDLSALRWTIDYPEDLEFARQVYRRLDARGIFLMRDILELLERHPEIARINQGIARNEGYQRSLDKDKEHS